MDKISYVSKSMKGRISRSKSILGRANDFIILFPRKLENWLNKHFSKSFAITG
jgi:hypothetical protein